MTAFRQLLMKLNACDESIKWSGDRIIEQIVNDCHRGDWLLWLAKHIEIDHRKFTLAKGHCANTVRHLMKYESSIKAVDTAIAYGEGKATEKELRNADAAADAAYAAYDSAAYSAASAAASAASGASGAASAAASAAADAAYAAADAAADAAYFAGSGDYAAADAAYAAREENRQQTADICRKYIGKDIIDKVKKLLS